MPSSAAARTCWALPAERTPLIRRVCLPSGCLSLSVHTPCTLSVHTPRTLPSVCCQARLPNALNELTPISSHTVPTSADSALHAHAYYAHANMQTNSCVFARIAHTSLHSHTAHALLHASTCTPSKHAVHACPAGQHRQKGTWLPSVYTSMQVVRVLLDASRAVLPRTRRESDVFVSASGFAHMYSKTGLVGISAASAPAQANQLVGACLCCSWGWGACLCCSWGWGARKGAERGECNRRLGLIRGETPSWPGCTKAVLKSPAQRLQLESKRGRPACRLR